MTQIKFHPNKSFIERALEKINNAVNGVVTLEDNLLALNEINENIKKSSLNEKDYDLLVQFEYTGSVAFGVVELFTTPPDQILYIEEIIINGDSLSKLSIQNKGTQKYILWNERIEAFESERYISKHNIIIRPSTIIESTITKLDDSVETTTDIIVKGYYKDYE